MPDALLEPIANNHAFSYEEFTHWYAGSCNRTFGPAQDSFTNLLDALLERELDDIARARIRLSARVKSPIRLWLKLNSTDYQGQANSLGEIPEVIDDIVGLRITCNNISDVVRIRELIATLPSAEDNDGASLAADPAEEKLYYRDPKKSGYRAYHINLVTLVPHPGGWTRVVSELQVRTLLQDSWGELTHEDTYKASVGLPPLAEKIARRMADVLATVDDLAQDLRDELERAASQSVADVVDEVEADPDVVADGSNASLSAAVAVPPAPLRQALVDETRRIVGKLTRQAPLAQVSGLVQGAFGREISNDWGGFGSFRALLEAAVPEATVVSTPPGYVVPPGVLPSGVVGIEATTGEHPDDVPGVPQVIRRLHLHDRSLPEVGQAAIGALIEAIADALSSDHLSSLEIDLRSPGIRDTNALAKHLRDRLLESPTPFSRSQIDYMLKALLFSGNLRAGIDTQAVGEILAGWFMSRGQMLGAVTDPVEDRDEIRDWVGLKP